MTPWIWCPRCGQQNPAPKGAADRTVRCRRCRRRFAVLAPGRPSPSATKPPQQIGRFLVRERVGAGVFGTVYRAYDPQLQREVAVKVSRPGSLADDERRERFLREARAAARLAHPFIVPIYEIGDDGEQYIASAFIEGPTLAAACAAGTLDCRRAALVVHDLARALAYAHKLGVVHRDVKPANVILDQEGRPHLTDFGLAYRHDAGDRPTEAGAIVGTPHYLAPELVLGRRETVEPASDQYSLGVVLYELLCGHPPFTGVPQAVLYQAVHSQPIPPHQPRPDVPRALEAICLRAMARRPEDRYPSCDALADDLRRWLVSETLPQPPSVTIGGLLRWCRGQPAVIFAVVFAVCLTAGVLWLASSHRDAHAQPEQTPREAPSLPAVERPAEKGPGRKETRGRPKTPPDAVKKDKPVVAAPPPPKPAPPPAPPPVAGRIVARKDQANLLLERRPDSKTWQALSVEKTVSAPALLLALPGVRGTVRLTGGLEMTLWGNVREAFIPIPEYESAVLLHPTTAGPPEFTLDRGRILLTNPTAGPLTCQVRLKDAPAAGTWEVTLEGGGTEVALEVFRLLLPRAAFPAGTPPQTEWSLIVLHGEAAVKVNGSVRRALPDQGPMWFFWSSRQGGEPELRQFPKADLQYFRKELPDTRAAADMTEALNSLLPRLEADKPIAPLLQELLQAPQPARRLLAVYCLGALEMLPELLDCLADEEEGRPDIRRTALYAVLHWLEGGDHDVELLRALVQEKKYQERQAATVVELLHGFTDAQLKEPPTWERLIFLLKSERPAIRELAYYHLVRLVPEGRRQQFDPGISAEQRERAFGEWKTLIPEGKLPPGYTGQKAGSTR
jgi:serine/threonine protein kinase